MNKNYNAQDADNMNSFWFWLSVIANLCQIESYQMNMVQISNDDLLKHLQEQDVVLDNQTNVYLKRIVEQNDELLKILKERR